MKSNFKKMMISISLCVMLIISSMGCSQSKTDINSDIKDFTKQPGYEQLLENVIAKKNEDIRLSLEKRETEGNDWFIVTKEMEEDPKYQNPDGSLDMELICKDLGVVLKPYPEGALKQIQLSAVESSIEPHVLEHAEVAIYSNEKGESWNLQKGDKIRFHIYMDIEHYDSSGHLYFGEIKDGEPFLNNNPGEKTYGVSEKEFEFVASESGEYKFSLFCGSTEPIIIKWIDISNTY